MQTVDLQYTPGILGPVVHVSQMDVGRQFQLRVYNDDGTAYSMPNGTTLSIDGIKPDKKAFSYTDNITISGNLITITTKLQMTCVHGMVDCEVRFKKDGNNIGTLNFKMMVEASPINEDADISNTELPAIIELAEEEAQMAIEAAGRAALSATSAADSATAASGSATSASGSATTATNQALKAEGFAVGEQNGVDVPGTSPYYHNNAEYYAHIAGQYSVNVPYIGPNGNWWVWNTTTSTYVDSGVDASITVQIADITMLPASDPPYVTNTGTDTDPIFHLFIPQGVGITGVTYSSSVGLEDYYIITFSDNTTTSFTVTNGATGAAAGFGIPTASVDTSVGTPSVIVTASGPDTAKIFDFAFQNLKGATGATGPMGPTGPTGNGIVTISKTSTSGLEDTYTITYSDGTTTTFPVVNGKGISSITKTGTSGLVDTYTITYNSGSPTTFQVVNGKTAYQSAVAGGYSGSEQDFENDLANFETWATNSANSATAAANSATAAAGSATSANQSYLDAKAQADRAQVYANFLEPHFIIQNNRLYIKDDAVGEFVTANNRLYMKLVS